MDHAPARRHLQRVVLVANQKGGVGKSSLVSAVAGMIAGGDRRVLVVDADQQGNVSRNDFGVEGDRGRSLAMALQYGQPLNPVREVRPGLDVVPGGPFLAGVAGMVASANQTGIDLTANFMATMAGLCGQESYALTLVDSGPGDAGLLDVLLHTSRYLVVPSCDDEASYDGVQLLAQRYLHARSDGAMINLLGVVLFNVNPRASRRNQDALAALTELLEGSGAEAFKTTIRTDKAAAIDLRRQHMTPAELVVEAQRRQGERLERLRQPGSVGAQEENRIWARDPSGLANDYQMLAREILQRVASYEGRHRLHEPVPS